METVTKNNISKKSLKVAINEPNQNISLSVNEPVKTNEERNDEQSLEASKTNVKLTKKGKVDARVEIGKKNPNLALGRQKLAEVWAEKRRIKDELMQKAVEKKLLLALKQKEQINKSFGITEETNSDSDNDENKHNELVEELTKKQIIKETQPLVKEKPKKVIKEIQSKPVKEIVVEMAKVYLSGLKNGDQLFVDFLAAYSRLYKTIKTLKAEKQFKIVIESMNIGYDTSSLAYQYAILLLKSISDPEAREKLKQFKEKNNGNQISGPQGQA